MGQVLRYIRRHHIGLLALMIALGGTAYAADKIGSKDIAKKAIKTKHIAPQAVKAKQIALGAVTGAAIADNSLTGAQIDEATLQSSRVTARLRATNRNVPLGAPGTLGHSLGRLGTWTQAADESNEFFGKVVVRMPPGCNSDGGIRGAIVMLARPGVSMSGGIPRGIIGTATALVPDGASSVVTAFTPAQFAEVTLGDPDATEPGAATTRAADIYALAYCGDGSTQGPVIEQIDLTVVGHR